MKKILNVAVKFAKDIKIAEHLPESTPIKAKERGEVIFYNNNFFTFDIETTALEEIGQSFMYIWQFYTGELVIIGRTWEEFKQLILAIEGKYKTLKTVIYVHFLSHEFQYFSGIYNFSNEDIFAIEPRKILKCKMGSCVEFRCSYLLSNMSLGQYTEKMQVEHKKLSGDLDYSVRRTHLTELTDAELAYCVNDVVGLHEAITKEMEISGDSIATIPLTSTGYVRRDCRKVMTKYKRTLIDKIFPNYYIYTLLRQAFRGGNVHASRFYAGCILKDVQGDDIKSSYIAAMGNGKYPVTKFKLLDGIDPDLDYYIDHGYACLARIILTDVELKNEMWGFPYLPFDKCRGVENKVLDNGRILSADMLEITVTDIDYKIINKEYKFSKCYVKDLAIANYGDLPKELKDVLIDYFSRKTALDGVEDMFVFYTKAKNKLNSVYGMMVQCPVKEQFAYNGGKWDPLDLDESDQLHDYKQTAFLPYQWGVWVTAHARAALEAGLDVAADNAVYCDTDCVYHFGEFNIAEYNMQRLIDAEQTGLYAKAPDGTTKYVGLYEPDKKKYDRFITWGAKKYAGEIKGEIKITIAGVNKKAGAKELEEKGGLEALKDGFVFNNKRKGDLPASAGSEFVYNDSNYGWYNVDGVPEYITRNLYSYESEYKLHVQPDYMEVIKHAALLVEHYLKNY